MGAFEDALRQFEQKAMDREAAFTRSAATQVVQSLVEKTPVSTGKSRGNWRVRLKRPARRVLKRKDKTGAVTLRAAIRALSRVKPGSTIYITNNWYVPLILDRGTAKIRPVAMVDRTLSASDAIIQKALFDARRAAP